VCLFVVVLACHAEPLLGRMRPPVQLAFHVLDHRRVAEPAVQLGLLGLDEVTRLFGLERHATLRDRTQSLVQRFPVRLARPWRVHLGRLHGRIPIDLA
jgi:hypothetical protein